MFVISVFVRYNNTPIIMASGRELCYVLMAGMLLCYAMTFLLVSKPTLLTCALSRAGLGLSLALCYSALFTKTNRISRIFNRGLKAMVKRPSYTSPRSQLAICFCTQRWSCSTYQSRKYSRLLYGPVISRCSRAPSRKIYRTMLNSRSN